MKRELRAVQQAVVNRNKAHQRYLEALRRAQEAGCTLEEIAAPTGLTRQTIWYTLNKENRK